MAYLFDWKRDKRYYDRLVELMEGSDGVCMIVVRRPEIGMIETFSGHTFGDIAVGFSENAKLYALCNEELFVRYHLRETVYGKPLRVRTNALIVPAQR
ncbi:MAG: hypothetical protein ACRDF4_05520 [Rhabdochlamydiaceae bacterium]